MSTLSEATSGSIVAFEDITDNGKYVVSGKADTLAKLRKSGFKVPDGCVLTTRFFEDWLEHVGRESSWQSLLNHSRRSQTPDQRFINRACNTIQSKIGAFEFDDIRAESFKKLLEHLPKNPVVAVRSSCVEEDLQNLSFAGQYKSFLDIHSDELADAIRDCFASAFSFEVVQYKHKNDIPLDTQGIAVIVQRQLESTISGVAFSVNPLNNDFDELVVNVHAGLGEDLVSGQVTPEYWCLNKLSGEVIDFREHSDHLNAAPLLSDQFALTLRTDLIRIESLKNNPVDVEFAVEDGQLYILQSRPITNWIPLMPQMQTKPGEKRRLYVDPGLADGITIGGALSPLTNDLNVVLTQLFADNVLTKNFLDTTPGTGFVFTSGARSYGNFSKLLDYADPKKFADSRRLIDVSLANLYANFDFGMYKANQRTIRQTLLVFLNLLKIIWRLRPAFCTLIWMNINFGWFTQKYANATQEFEKFVENIDTGIPIHDLISQLYGELGRVMLHATGPALGASVFAGTMSLTTLAKRQTSEIAALIDDLKTGSHNVVRDMGVTMYKLAHTLPVEAYEDLDQLRTKFEAGDVSRDFLSQWHDFRRKFGSRGPYEMDLAYPKYGDSAEVLLRQLKYVRADESNNPEGKLKEKQRRRSEAIDRLSELTSPKVYRKIVRAYNALLALEHSREMPKHHTTMVGAKLRERLLELAFEWAHCGRLDDIDEIFELTFSDIEAAEEDPSYDIRNAAKTNGAFYRKVKHLVRYFPHFIDSRGRIIREVREVTPGQWRGAPVSPGIVRGRVNIVHDPNRKEVQPGDILVAYTTDPGWTPPFINVAGIVLEVGGELQHGALIAREYGKPCVVGAVGVVNGLVDGQVVEVDGTSGAISIVD